MDWQDKFGHQVAVGRGPWGIQLPVDRLPPWQGDRLVYVLPSAGWLALQGPIDQDAPIDLISFLKAIPDGRYRRGVRYPQWFLLLVAVLGILSDCRGSRDLEASAMRHREAFNQALGLNFKR